MPLFDTQRETLRKLVALARGAKKSDFYFTCNSMGDHVDFEAGDTSSHTFDNGRLGEVMPTEYIKLTSRCRAIVSDAAFDSVESSFASPLEATSRQNFGAVMKLFPP